MVAPLFFTFAAMILASASLLFASPDGFGEASAAENNSYIDFDRHSSFAGLSAGKKSNTVVVGSGAGAYVRLANGTSQGALTSKVYPKSVAFDTLVPSWNAVTPSGTWVEVEVRVRDRGTGWSRWFSMGPWASGKDTVRRGSVDGQETDRWAVSTDTLQSKGQVFADAYQYRISLATKKRGATPRVRAVSVVNSDSYRHGGSVVPASDRGSWGKNLAVPQRSQMIYPDGGEVWCSSTSLSMVMAYWSAKRGVDVWNKPVPTVASGTYDNTYEGNGNWPFNVAYASSLGLEGDVSRFGSLAQAEEWVEAGVPVIASISWGRGQLDGAAIPSSEGHLLVVRGFTKSGDVVVNDPAAFSDSGVARAYDRRQFYDAWMRGSEGIVYLVRPVGWTKPGQEYSGGSW
ncbi:MAG: C39 family peptidase [Rubrobacter sp.]